MASDYKTVGTVISLTEVNFMEIDTVITLARNAIIVTLIISAPILIAGLIIGLIVGIFQAVTQIHEMTLTFIPKIVAMILVLLALMPWILLKMVEYSISVFNLIPEVIK